MMKSRLKLDEASLVARELENVASPPSPETHQAPTGYVNIEHTEICIVSRPIWPLL